MIEMLLRLASNTDAFMHSYTPFTHDIFNFLISKLYLKNTLLY
jgi:hypothetical protein